MMSSVSRAGLTGDKQETNLLVLFSVVIFLSVATSGGIAAPFSDLNWVSLGGLRGFDGDIKAVAVNTNSGVIYVGGSFQLGGDTIFNYIAKLDNGQWSALGSGLESDSANSVIVNVLALDNAGNLYVGGRFQRAGGISANGLAKWDGNQWTGLGTNLGNGGAGVYVNALAFDPGGNLYIGGDFTTADAIPVNCVAKWNGSSWSALGSGISGANLNVSCLTFDHNGNLIIGGRFNNAGGIPANNVAQWNGTNWSGLGSGIGGTFARVVTSTVDSHGKLYVGGDFTSAGGVSAKSLAKWDGNNWSALGSGLGITQCGMGPQVYSLVLDSANNVFASGEFGSAGGIWTTNVARWDGTNWSALGFGVGGDWCGARVYPLTFDAGGNLLAAWGNLLSRWDGTNWLKFQPQPEPFSPGVSGEVTALVADRNSNLYVGGSFSEAGGIAATNIAKWNGITWSPLGPGLSGSDYYTYVYALVRDSAGDLYAGGNFTTAGDVPAVGVAKWSGNAWSALSSGTNGIHGSVRALVFDSVGNLYAGGSFTTGSNSVATNISRWNGNSWLPVGGGINGQVYALAVDKFGNLYAGGSFWSAGGTSAANIAKWNGITWSPLGTGIMPSQFSNQPVMALVVDPDGNLYAGGSFTNAGGIVTSKIAKWNGNSWSALGAGVSGNVQALVLDITGTLYVGEDNVLKWESGAWMPLGSGIRGYPGSDVGVNALTIGGIGRLYTGGFFSIAGTNVSYRIAQANILGELLNPMHHVDGSYSFDLVTTPKTTNRILATTNLTASIVWQPISTNLAPVNGVWHFIDTNAHLYPGRFYRSSTP